MRSGGRRIFLYGLFGIGNTGNDATLGVTLDALKRELPDAQFAIITPEAEKVEAEFGVPAVALQAHGDAAKGLPRLLAAAIRELRRWRTSLRVLRGADVLLVPGTGIFDDFHTPPHSFPYRMWRWCWLARRRGARVMFVSVGSGPIEHPWSRRLFSWAAKTAVFRSYRDEASKTFTRDAMGVDVSADEVTPDLVFGLKLDAPLTNAGALRTVGVGVIGYHTWRGASGGDDDVYPAYMEKLSTFCAELLDRGLSIRILIGDAGDEPAADDLRARLAAARPDRADAVVIGAVGTLQDLCADIAQTDAVVASRYHTIVGALLSGRPAVSIGYAFKNKAVMSLFGVDAYCQNIWDFDLETLRAHFETAVADLARTHRELAEPAARLRAEVEGHLAAVARKIENAEG